MQFHRPTLLDPDKHHRDEFTSSETTLDEWLRRYAGQNRRGDTAAVWVIADANHNVVYHQSTIHTLCKIHHAAFDANLLSISLCDRLLTHGSDRSGQVFKAVTHDNARSAHVAVLDLAQDLSQERFSYGDGPRDPGVAPLRGCRLLGVLRGVGVLGPQVGAEDFIVDPLGGDALVEQGLASRLHERQWTAHEHRRI